MSKRTGEEPAVDAASKPRRSCGTCRACCKVAAIPELDKPMDTWCRHVSLNRRSEKGCTNYAQRPAVCSGFECGWLMGMGNEADRPDKLGIVMQPTLRDDQRVLAFVEYRPGSLGSPRAMELMAQWAAAHEGAVIVRRTNTTVFKQVPITINRAPVTTGILGALGRSAA